MAPTIAKVMRDFLAEQEALRSANSPDALAPSTITLYQRILGGPEIGSISTLRLDSLSVARIERLRAQLFGRGCSSSYVRQHTDVLSAICGLAWRRGEIQDNPMDLWKVRSRPIRTKKRLALEVKEIDVIVDRESVLALLDASHGPVDWKMRGMILMGIGSGMRLGEMRGLRWKNIRHPDSPPEHRTIRIVENWPVNGNEGELPKTGRSRSVLYPRLLGEWYERNRHRGTMEELVFGKTNAVDLLRMLTRRCYRAGFASPANFQAMRHTFASHLLTYGYPLEWVADQLGNTPDVARRHYAKYLDPWRRPTPVPDGMNPTDLIFTGGQT